MNQEKMERRLEAWINLVQQCERECKELNITKDQWIKNTKLIEESITNTVIKNYLTRLLNI